jgi:hypothetical protein
VTLAAVAFAAFALLALAPFAQARVVVTGFGVPGSGQNSSFGGQIVGAGSAETTIPGPAGTGEPPAGIAVNTSGNGAAAGTVYVADYHGGRVQRFGSTGAFQRAWGENVSGRDEYQLINFAGKVDTTTSGTFTLSFGGSTTVPITVSGFGSGQFSAPSQTTVRDALAALPSIGAGNVTVTPATGNGFYVRFIGTLGGTDVEQVKADGSGLTGPPLTVSTSTVEQGSGGNFAGYEICTVASTCQDGVHALTTGNGGQLNDPQGIAVYQATGNVYVADGSNFRIEEFDPDGNFLRAWGWDVVKTGGVGDVSNNDFEICTVAADCKKGVSGSSGGQFAFPRGVALDSAGDVWTFELGNRRFQEFSPSGAFIAAYGYGVNGGGALEKCESTVAGICKAATEGTGPGQFSGFSRGQIAFDSAGNLYALDSNRVQKFNPTLTSVADFSPANFSSTKQPYAIVATVGGSRLAIAFSNGEGSASESQIVELDATDGSVKDTSLVGSGLTGAIGALAYDPAAAGTLYATTPLGISPRSILALGTALPTDPVFSVSPVTTKTATTATFSGSIDPKGGLVGECKFQYSTDQVSWTSINEPDCATLDAQGGAQAVTENATGLAPNTHYFIRLSVARALVPGSAKVSAAKSFDTDSEPPVVSNPGAVQVTDASARLVATIDPRHSQTAYVFRYGTTPALGSSTAPVDIGSGSTPLIVSQVISGLSPDTTYYFKIIATNLLGESSGSTKSFHTRADPLPSADQRAYELVSPPDKNFGDIEFATAVAVAWDGNAAAFCAPSAFGDPAGQPTTSCADYRSARGADGWHTRWFGEPFCVHDLNDTSGNAANVGVAVHASANLDRAVITHPENSTCANPPLDPTAPTPAQNLYLSDYAASPVSHTLLASKPVPVPKYNAATASLAATSDDFSHIVYTSTGPQTPDAPAQSGLCLTLSETFCTNSVFDWHGGTVSLVSKNTANTAFATSSGVPSNALHPVSADGSRIFFQNPATGNSELYVRADGTVTYDVSQTECTSSCGAAKTDTFVVATPNGNKALIRSDGKLTDDDTSTTGACTAASTAGCDLFLYTQSANPASDPHNLTMVSKDNEPSDGTVAGVQGMLGMSDDGNTVFFVANGQLVAGAPTVAGYKVYRWRWNGGSPTVDYLATLNTTACSLPVCDARNWTSGPGSLGTESREVTPDGKYLLIFSKVALDPVADQDVDQDVYRWDEQHGWRCLSCQVPGVPSGGDSFFTLNSSLTSENHLPRVVMSDDGQRAVFTTPDALVPADTNGPCVEEKNNSTSPCQDVYEWNDGAVRLISSGTSTAKVELNGISRDGRDVFFTTYSRLVGWDADNLSDVYDARIGGGFPEPPAIGAACEGEACRGSATNAAAVPGAGTAAFEGPGNQPKPAGCKRGLVKRGDKCVKPRKKKRHTHKSRRQASDNRRAAK